MLDFYKGFKKEKETQIATNYIKITEEDRINRIKNQRGEIFNKIKQEDAPCFENHNVHRERVQALKNIKKD